MVGCICGKFPRRPLNDDPPHSLACALHLKAFCVWMGLVEMLRLCGRGMLVSNEVVSLVGAVGLIALALSWHKRNASPVRLAQIGWVCVGLYFFNDASLYLAHDDLILTLFSVMTLPMAVGMACLLYTSPSPRDRSLSRMPSSA